MPENTAIERYEVPEKFSVLNYHRLLKSRPAHNGKYYGFNASSKNPSLTDLCILSAVSAAARECGSATRILSGFPEFEAAMKFHPWYEKPSDSKAANIHRAMESFDCGYGHVIERLFNFFGLPKSYPPRGRFINPSETIKGKMFISLKVRKETQSWNSGISNTCRRMLARWIASRRDITISARSYTNFESLITELGSCEYYLGIPSGAMHLATALSKKCIVIVSDIEPKELVLPIKDICHRDKMKWLYPQNEHLLDLSRHPRLSVSMDNLNAAMERLSVEFVDLEPSASNLRKYGSGKTK